MNIRKLIALLIFSPWIGANMIAFATQIFELIAEIPLAGQ